MSPETAAPKQAAEFSFRTREKTLQRFREESFDLLVIGGGITGAGTARDAATRGLKVAVVERGDFASGTSSKSSKLIHGGLRYLQNFEFGLVFEALAERALLLKRVPHMVRPLPFYFPSYEGDSVGKGLMGMGMWLYDLLALFRAPGFHRGFSRKKLLERIPFLRAEGLQGGYLYYDASMWDDVLAVITLRSAHDSGAAVANYVEAVAPIWEGSSVRGFRVRDRLSSNGEEIVIRASRVVVCAGPWTDFVGATISPEWKPWLKPSKGIHLIFDAKRIPVPGAIVMNHPEDGRISFVIPRPDYGAGVVIVGTTDSPSPYDPGSSTIEPEDVRYLLDLLDRYFPDLKISASDILSGYVGVRPLVDPNGGAATLAGSEGQALSASQQLQKVSREHHIDRGPGGTVFAAGGKYTTHRKMAEEIVDFTLKTWKQDAKAGKAPAPPRDLRRPRTRVAPDPWATLEAMEACRRESLHVGVQIPEALMSRYGAEAMNIVKLSGVRKGENPGDPEGFPLLEWQLRYSIRTEMVMHLADFYLRRLPLYASRADHGMPWAEKLARVFAEELGLDEEGMRSELARLREEVERRSAWQKKLAAHS